MKISKTKIKSHLKRKTNPELVETIRLALKNPNWLETAKILASSTRRLSMINLSEIEKNSTAGDTMIIHGKILSQGQLTKKIRLSAMAISQQAKEKLKITKSEFIRLIEEIKKNPRAEGIKIVR